VTTITPTPTLPRQGGGSSDEAAALIRGIYVLADNTPAPEKRHIHIVKAALLGGVKIIQLRAKNLAKADFAKIASEAAKLCQEHGALLIINDYLDIALEVRAGGVHLGSDDLPIEEARKLGPDLIIGRSTHRLEEAVEAEGQGADYVAFGAIFPTLTKGRHTPIQGVEKLKEVCAAMKKPVAAIGGINRANLPEIKKAGAAAAAFISEVVCAESIENRVRELIKIWETA